MSYSGAFRVVTYLRASHGPDRHVVRPEGLAPGRRGSLAALQNGEEVNGRIADKRLGQRNDRIINRGQPDLIERVEPTGD